MIEASVILGGCTVYIPEFDCDELEMYPKVIL